jgi:hypothetical protein
LEDKVNKTKQFALHFAAVALLVGTSAFADSRHSDATRDRELRRGNDRTTVEQRSTVQRDTARSYTPQQQQPQQQQQQQRTETRNWDRNNNQNRSFDRNNTRNQEQNRTYDRNRSNDNRSYDRNRGNDNRSYDRNRGNDNRSYDRNRGYAPSYGRGNAYYHDGRISRIDRWNGGFRIYLGGAPYPFFVPEARFRLFNWRVGLSIRLGGYYNPLGYYDYYDAGVYGPGAVASAGDVHGIVESVDYRRGTMVVRDDVSGSFVTVMMRGGDPRFDALRIGDAVDLSGEWVRGYFEAYNVNRLDAGYDGYYRR